MDEADLIKSADVKFLSLWAHMRNGRTSWDNGRYMTYPLGDYKTVMNRFEKNDELAEKTGKPTKFDRKRNDIPGLFTNKNLCNEKPIRQGETISACV